MMFYTHIAFAMLCSLLCIKFMHISNPLTFLIVAIIFAVIADIDNKDSKLGRKLKLYVLFKHRGVMHSIFPVLVFALVFLIFNLKFLIPGMVVGYLSHLFIDSFTLSGIYIFYPFKGLRFKGFIKTNSLTEWVLFVIFITSSIILLIKKPL